MTRERCEYCGQEERYGHNAICVMNTLEELRAEIEHQRVTIADTMSDLAKAEAEVEEWKERWAAERRDHETTIRHFDELMNETP